MNTIDFVILGSQIIAVILMCYGCYGLGKVRGAYESEMKRILAEKAKLKAQEFHKQLEKIAELIINDFKKMVEQVNNEEKSKEINIKKSVKK